MDGQPVWLCSVSLVGTRGIIGTSEWLPGNFKMAEQIAHGALRGVGDPSRERAFRMNVTFCIHRAISDAEKAKLPKQWACAPGGLAGGPIEVLWSRGIDHKPASMPCKSPRRLLIYEARPDLWVPEDCGKCEPCDARAKIWHEIEAKGDRANMTQDR